MNQELVDEIRIDLVLDDVMNETSLVEGNAAHDAKGRFAAKGAAAGGSKFGAEDARAGYQSGMMAAGRAAGIRAKKEGKSREEVRAAIKSGMKQHMEKHAPGGGNQDLGYKHGMSLEGAHNAKFVARADLAKARKGK